MTAIYADIISTPEVLRQTRAYLDREGAQATARFRDLPVAFLGCGSSYGLAIAAAACCEDHYGLPAQAFIASEYRPRPGWSHVAISRTGKTTELIAAMRQARDAGAPVLLLSGDPGSPAEAAADLSLVLDFAPERSVIQTRFVSAALLALRLLIADTAQQRALATLPTAVQETLERFDPAPLAGYEHVVFLGRRERYGVARLAALNLQETAILAAEGHQTLDYRHGPIASAGPGTLVWCFDPPADPASAAVLDDARETGARVYTTADDPQVSLVQAQLVAVQQAARRGIDPDAPRHLSRAVVLPSMGVR